MTSGSPPNVAQRWRTLALLVAGVVLLAALILAGRPTRMAVFGPGTAGPHAARLSLHDTPQLAAPTAIHAYDETDRATHVLDCASGRGARELALHGCRADYRGAAFAYDSPLNPARTNARQGIYRSAPNTAQSAPRYAYRTGSQTDNALTDATGVSFRDSISSSLDSAHPQVFRPGDKIWAVDTELLPPGAVVPDGVPAGHVSVNATPEQIRAAIAREGSPLEAFGLRPLDDPGAFRLPGKR